MSDFNDLTVEVFVPVAVSYRLADDAELDPAVIRDAELVHGDGDVARVRPEVLVLIQHGASDLESLIGRSHQHAFALVVPIDQPVVGADDGSGRRDRTHREDREERDHQRHTRLGSIETVVHDCISLDSSRRHGMVTCPEFSRPDSFGVQSCTAIA